MVVSNILPVIIQLSSSDPRHTCLSLLLLLPWLIPMPSQLGWPDMRLPIMYTMSWPERVATQDATWPRLDFTKASSLTFKKPDNEKYPSMNLAYAAGRAGGTMTGVLSAANEQVGVGEGSGRGTLKTSKKHGCQFDC